MKAIRHPGQSPERLEVEKAECLRERRIAAKFHYLTHRQAELWLKLHQQFAPPADMAAPYQAAADALAKHWPHRDGALLAIGCGGGEKDRTILDALPPGTRFFPADVSEPLALQAAAAVEGATPLVFDLAAADGLAAFLDEHVNSPRVVTFLGLLPNFHPQAILPQLRAILRPDDRLLLSANLAPKGIGTIRPQYDNAPTRDWLAEFPRAHGTGEGAVDITIETNGELHWIAACYRFTEPCVMRANDEEFPFQKNDTLPLFTSHRYTTGALSQTLKQFGIGIEQAFTTANGEEGVFLCSPQ